MKTICLLCRQRYPADQEEQHAHLDVRVSDEQWRTWQQLYTAGVEHGRKLVKRVIH